MTRLRELMLQELQRRNYSQTTVTSYIKIVRGFCEVLSASARPTRTGRHPGLSTAFTPGRKQGVRTVGTQTAALRFFFCKTLKRNYPVEKCRIREHRESCRSS